MPSNSFDSQCSSLQARIAELEQENERFAAQCDRLRKSEFRYRQVVENSPISISFYASDGCHVEANAAFERMMGFTVADSQRVEFNLFTDPVLVENGTLPFMLQALAGETVIEPPTNFYNCRHLYGEPATEYIPGQGHYFPIWNEAGEVEEIVEMAPVVTDLLRVQQDLLQERELAESQRHRAAQERANLLSTNTAWSVATAQVANLLLRSPDYTTVLPDVVRLLGEAVGRDRCEVFQRHAKSGIEDDTMQFLAEWCGDNVPRSTDIEFDLQSGFPCHAAVQFYERNVVGEIANFLVIDLLEPAKSIFQEQGNTSILSVPIMVGSEFWGAITFDNCGEARLYDEAEIAILKIAADSIAAAIERQAKDDELRESEKRFRELFENTNDGINFLSFDQPISLSLPTEEQVDLIYQLVQFIDINPAGARSYGFNSPEEIIGKRLSELHSPDSNHRFLMRQVVENGWNLRNVESDDIDEYGSKRYWLSNLFTTVENGYAVRGWGIVSNVTELKVAQEALLQAEQARTALLKTVTTIANQLLRSSDYTAVLPTVLQLLGEAAHADRCSLLQNVTAPQSGNFATRMHMEWCRDGIQASIMHTPALETALLWEDFPEFQARLSHNQTISFTVADLAEPARSLLLDQGNVTMAMVPIVVNGEFWGVFGFDYCTEARLLDEADQGIYAIAVDSIAAAIERQQQDDALRDALREMEGRDRLLEATATAATTLLTVENLDEAVNTALQIIGESLDTDRMTAMENFDHSSDQSFPYWQVLHEWRSPGTVPQFSNLDAAQGSYEEIQWLYELFQQDQTASYLIEEAPEPFRSSQAAIGVKATHLVPIFVEGQWWGVLGLDDCCEAKRRSPSELAVLKTAAACIGSAIQRDRTQKAILQAEQVRSRSVAERSQELEHLNAELQQAIAQLAESEERYRLVTLATKEAICDYNITTQKITWYEGSNNPFGHTAGQPSRAVDLDWWLSLIHPDDRDRVEQQAHLFFEGPTDRWLNEYRFQRADGTYAHVLDAGIKAYDAAGQPRRVLGAVMDITAQREAEAALRAEVIERRRAEQLARGQSEALVRTSAILAAQPSLENVLDAVLSSIVDGLQFQAGSIWLYDSGAEILQLNTRSDHPLFTVIAPPEELVLSFSAAEIAELRSHPFVLHTQFDFAQNPLYQPYESYLAQLSIGSILTIPLVFGETFLGCLAICSHHATDFQIAAIDLACALAHQASLAVQLTQLATEAQHVAILEERNRMAREIHDTLAHAFTGILMQLQAAQRLQQSDPTTAVLHLDNASQIARRGLSEARRSVQALRPEALEATDLATALQRTIQQTTANTEIQAEVTVIGIPFALPPELELHLLRIGQESLTNALKYAQARSIALHLTFAPDMVELQIRDDGQGFDPQALADRAGFGLLGMRERAQRIEAEFTLTSQVGQGTCITVSVPIIK